MVSIELSCTIWKQSNLSDPRYGERQSWRSPYCSLLSAPCTFDYLQKREAHGFKIIHFISNVKLIQFNKIRQKALNIKF